MTIDPSFFMDVALLAGPPLLAAWIALAVRGMGFDLFGEPA